MIKNNTSMKLRSFINSMRPQEQIEFAKRCGTTIGYLRKAISKGQAFGADICVEIEKNSHGAVTCEELRPDIDWAYIRGNAEPKTGTHS